MPIFSVFLYPLYHVKSQRDDFFILFMKEVLKFLFFYENG